MKQMTSNLVNRIPRIPRFQSDRQETRLKTWITTPYMEDNLVKYMAEKTNLTTDLKNLEQFG